MANSADHELFVDLLTQQQARLFGYIHALVHNFSDAEDLYQQTTLVLWEKFEQFEPGTNFLGWACQVARYVVADFARRQRRSRSVFAEALAEQLASIQVDCQAEEPGDRLQALAHCLEKLSPQDRRLVELCYGESKGFARAAKMVGRTVESVYVSLSRVRRALLECIQRALTAEEY